MIHIVTNADHLNTRLNKIENVLTRAALEIMTLSAERIQKKMQKPGLPIRYPVIWDTEKQRQAFFASNGFGGGIPYRRTNERPNAWVLRNIRDGVELSNRAKGAVYLYGRADGADISPGKKQSNIHKGRHPLFRPAVDEELRQMPQSIIARVRLELEQ